MKVGGDSPHTPSVRRKPLKHSSQIPSVREQILQLERSQFSQVSPEKFGRHSQRKFGKSSRTQVPPFKQGLGSHWLISSSHSSPIKPASHWHSNSVIPTATQSPFPEQSIPSQGSIGVSQKVPVNSGSHVQLNPGKAPSGEQSPLTHWSGEHGSSQNGPVSNGLGQIHWVQSLEGVPPFMQGRLQTAWK